MKRDKTLCGPGAGPTGGVGGASIASREIIYLNVELWRALCEINFKSGIGERKVCLHFNRSVHGDGANGGGNICFTLLELDSLISSRRRLSPSNVSCSHMRNSSSHTSSCNFIHSPNQNTV